MLLNRVSIKLINIILDNNPSSRKLLAKYYRMTFRLTFPGFGISAACDIDGRLITHSSADYDVVINIPLDSTSFLINRDKLALYKKISFNGNTTFGRELLEILSKLHLNGVYTKVDSPVMFIALNTFNSLIKIITAYLKLLANNGSNSIKEYLTYETQELITRFENDQFCDDVDELHRRSEYLEQQIKQVFNK